MKPDYVAEKSIVKAFSIWRILFCWLIIPAILIVIDILKLKNEQFEFYPNKIIHKSGLLSKNEKQTIFLGITGVSISRSLFGRLFDYGDVFVDAVGNKWDVSTNGIKHPEELKKYLESKYYNGENVDLRTSL